MAFYDLKDITLLFLGQKGIIILLLLIKKNSIEK